MSEEFDFLSFKEFILSKEHLDKDWITVSRFDDFNHDSFGTFSALAPFDEASIDKILSSSEWDVHTDFGKPYFSKSWSSQKIEYNSGTQATENGVVFKPFIILRSFHEAYPSRSDVIQEFILYHGLYFDSPSQSYIDPVTEQKIIEYVNPEYVRVKTIHLRDYLAAVKMVLVRYHDHSRYVEKPPQQILGKKQTEIKVHDKDRNFSIYIGNVITDERITYARLLGKDIVLPFTEPRHPDFLYLADKEEKKFVAFIIGVDELGKNIEETCNEKELSNFFVNKGKPHFLTLTFFKKEVLQKYYQNPRKYTVGSGYLHCLDLWGIPFDINKAGFVHVWLGDLGRLPYEEQLHFRQYNVPPSGGITKEFYETQLMAEFVEKKEPISDFKELLEEINVLSSKRMGFRLFQELTSEDSHVYKTLHVPTTNEPQELEEQLIFLSKIIVDSINKSELKKRVAWNPSIHEEDTHIRYLEKFLEETFKIGVNKADQIGQPFRTVQKLRSQSAAHRKSAELQETLSKLGLDNKASREIFEAVLSALTQSLESIKVLLEKISP